MFYYLILSIVLRKLYCKKIIVQHVVQSKIINFVDVNNTNLIRVLNHLNNSRTLCLVLERFSFVLDFRLKKQLNKRRTKLKSNKT